MLLMTKSVFGTVTTVPQYGHFAVSLIESGAPQFGQLTVFISFVV